MRREAGFQPKKKTSFTATDAEGKKHTWKFWYDSIVRCWMLEDMSGYVRTMESRWIDSVPCIQVVLENHGMTANIS